MYLNEVSRMWPYQVSANSIQLYNLKEFSISVGHKSSVIAIRIVTARFVILLPQFILLAVHC